MSSPEALLSGHWQLVRAEHAGNTAPDLVVDRTTLELSAGRYTMRFGGEIVDSGTFEVGQALDVTTIILHGRHGANAGRTIPCLYQLRGDRLRVCYGFDGVTPTEFATNDVNQRYLGTYRRV